MEGPHAARARAPTIRSFSMDRWDVIIIVVAGYVAVMTLVRLMSSRHNQMLVQIREQLTKQLRKKKKTKKKKIKTDEQTTQKDRGAA